MTTTTKKAKAGKRGKPKFPLPASTEKATIGGTEYLIIPYAEFEDWYTDQMLAAIASERLKAGRKQAVPWEEVVSRLQKKDATKGK